MLVLSRRIGEEIRLVEAGVTIKLMATKQSRAQIAIDAPRDVTVLRGELLTDKHAIAAPCTAQAAIERLVAWADSVDAAQLANALPVIDDLIERLVELRIAAHQAGTPGAIHYDDVTEPISVRSSAASYCVEAELPSPAERLPKLHAEGFTAPGCECV